MELVCCLEKGRILNGLVKSTKIISHLKFSTQKNYIKFIRKIFLKFRKFSVSILLIEKKSIFRYGFCYRTCIYLVILYCDFYLQEFELTLREWTELQEKTNPCVTSVQAEVLTSLVQCLSILVNW